MIAMFGVCNLYQYAVDKGQYNKVIRCVDQI